MRIKNVLLAMSVLLVSMQFALAISVEINVDDVFYLNDEVSFSYTFLSEEKMTVEYLPYVSCPSAPLSLLELREIELEPNVPLTLEYVYLSKVDGSMIAQECVAGIGIYGPNVSEEKSFEIITEDVLDFDLLTCADEKCSLVKKIFVSGETVYLNYVSNKENIETDSVLVYPDDSFEELTLPKQILLEDVGVYFLGSVVSYKDQVREVDVEFSVIEESSEVGYSLLDKKNNVDDADMNEEAEDGFKFGYVVVSILIVVLVLVFFILNKIKKSSSFKGLFRKKKGKK